MIPNVKDFNKLIGMGVAIKCDDGSARKFKVKAVNVCYAGDGRRVSGIAVDAPLRLCKYWKEVGWMKQDGGQWWIHPALVFRSKGECLRHDANEGIAQADRSIERFHAKIEEHQRALDALKQSLQKEERKKKEYLKSLKKWFRK